MKRLVKAEKGIVFFPFRLFVYITFFCFVVVTLLAFQNVSAVSILNKNDVEVSAFMFEKGDEFMIRFTHSWNRTPVDEVYRIGESELELQETYFEDFGAGLQSYEEPGQKMELIGKKIKISGIKRPVPNLTYRVGQILANHSLIMNGKETPLSVFVKPGEPIQFKLKKVPRWKLWRDLLIWRI
jgi:hypothetical protein